MSEYLEEEEQLVRLKSWWDENGTALVVGVVALVGGIIGWSWFGSYSETQRHDSTRAYEAYETAIAGEKVGHLETLRQEFGGSAVHLFALFDQAKTAVAEGDTATAQTLLDEAISAGDDQIVVDLARIRLAKLQRELGLSDEALQTLDVVRNEGYRALVLEAKGDIHASRGEIELAHQSYQVAVESLLQGETRPFLNMKLENTAPFGDEYVAMTDTLTEALKAAEDTLEAAAQDAESQLVEETEAELETATEDSSADE
ncbi:MAG: tetratricopeptide repeat protein [Pseudomonadales bacterium]|nr:tetratricopeptide repeat protein [Pseudomonadales bacterium]